MNAQSVLTRGAIVALMVAGAGSPIAARGQRGQGAAPDALALKLTVVISRYQGEKSEKKTSSLPFTLFVSTGDDTSLRMGAEIPVPTVTYTAKDAMPTTSYQYRHVGTSIDCSARVLEGGRYRLNLVITDSQIFEDPRAATSPALRAAPAALQSFSTQSILMLRDGESVQYTTATDKATGEVVKVDVTLNVVK